jgi:predicted DNA-binding transcriptional regulator YafY
MSVTKEFLKRCEAINTALINGNAKSTIELLHIVKKEIASNLTTRTIRNDIKAMKNGEVNKKKAPIEQGKDRKWYYTTPTFNLFPNLNLNEEEVNDLKIALITLEKYQNYGLFKKFSNAISKVIEAVEVNVQFSGSKFLSGIIHTDDPPYSKGSEILPKIVDAIQTHVKIKFSYQKFGENVSSLKSLAPYFVKEYKGRWYVIGESESGTFKTYGLDRIEAFEKTTENYSIRKDFDSERYFSHSMGVTITHSSPVRIIIEAYGKTTGYVKTMPLHSSQKILLDKGTKIRFEIKVIPTYELYSCLLGYGGDITVISPQKVKQQLMGIIKTMEKKYFSC